MDNTNSEVSEIDIFISKRNKKTDSYDSELEKQII